MADLELTRGREQAGVRPVLVVSMNPFNSGPAGLVVMVPSTTTERRVSWHVRVDPPEGGLRERSFLMCENLRSIAKKRLMRRWGAVSGGTMAAVEDRLRILLEL